MLLICRYQSERAEFIRNLDRVILFFDESDWMFYLWTTQKLQEFVHYSEKCTRAITLLKSNFENEELKTEEENWNHDLEKVAEILSELKRSIVYTSWVKPDGDELVLHYKKGDRKYNVFAQNLFRNAKVYDYLINFLFLNKDFFLEIRSRDLESLPKEARETMNLLRKTFKRLFRVLEYMTKNNPRNQHLLWKYKEDFVFKELKDAEQNGELELVLAIIEESDTYTHATIQSHDLKHFVNALNERIGAEENFVILLEIYNKLIRFDSMSFLKKPLIKLILDQPELIHTHTKETRQEFEKALNIQEILFSILSHQNMFFIRDYLKSFFPAEGFYRIVDASIVKLDELEPNDDYYDAQDYDELRDYQHVALLNLYNQLYLHVSFSTFEREELIK